MKKPKLSSREKVQVGRGDGALRAPGESVVQLGEKGAVLRLVKTILGLTFAAIVVLFALYLALAATLMRAIPEWDDFPSFTWVKNATFVAGIPAPGTYAFLSTDTVDDSPWGRLNQAFVGAEGGTVVQIIGGPYGEVHNDAYNRIFIAGEDTGFVGELPEQGEILSNQYVAKCIGGACGEPGVIFIIGQDSLLGEAQFRYNSEDGFMTYSEGSEKSPSNPLEEEKAPDLNFDDMFRSGDA